MPVMDTGPIDNRSAPRTASLSIRLSNSGPLSAIAGVEVYHVNPTGDGFANETVYLVRLVSLNPFGQPGSVFTVDNVFANLDVFGVRVITSGMGGSDIAAAVAELTADGQVIKEHVLTGEMALIPELWFAYVSNQNNSTMTVIETGTGNVVSTIGLPSGSLPKGSAIMPDGTRAYVALAGSPDGVAVISTASNEILAFIPFADLSDPFDVAILPDGSRAYVANLGGDAVNVIDTATNTILATIPLDFGSNPIAIAVTPDGSRVYTANQAAETVTVISTATNTVLTTIDLADGSTPNDIAITPDGSKAYVAAQSNDTVIVIDTAMNTVSHTIMLPAGSIPVSVAITPDGSQAYIANLGLPDAVTVINTATNEIMDTIPMPVDSDPIAIAITPDGSRAYVANFNTSQIAVIDTFSKSVVGTLSSVNGPVGIAITPILMF